MFLTKFKVDGDDYTSLACFKNTDNVKCFYCGNMIMGKNGSYGSHRNKDIKDIYAHHNHFCVQWMGNNADIIYLHPICAEELAMHLIKDVRSGELAFSKILG